MVCVWVGRHQIPDLAGGMASNVFDYVTFRRKAECVRSAVRCALSKSTKTARIRTSEAKSARTEHRSERSERRSGAHNPEVMRWLAAPRSCATSFGLRKILDYRIRYPEGPPLPRLRGNPLNRAAENSIRGHLGLKKVIQKKINNKNAKHGVAEG